MPPSASDLRFQEGRALQRSGRLAEAEAVYRSILAIEPDHVATLRAMGGLASGVGRLDVAIELLRRVVALDPRSAESYVLLGGLLGSAGRITEAVAMLEIAISLEPQNARARYNFGNAQLALGRNVEAVAAFQEAARLQPHQVETWNNLAVALQRLRHYDEAIESARAALRLDSAYREAWRNLGHALRSLGRFLEAAEAFEKAARLPPASASVCNDLGSVLLSARQIDRAAGWCREAIRLDPACAEAHANLGNCLKDQGQIEAALDSLRRAVALAPASSRLASAMVYALRFHPEHDEPSHRREEQRWDECFAGAVPHAPQRAIRFGSRPLRIGYVSPDFCDHVIGRNVLPLIRERDRDFARVYCYSGVRRPDFLTEQFRELSDEWREIGHLTDDEAAGLIARDEIDILVDLCLHLAGNRLLLFARKPAPVQVSFAAYPGGSGLQVVDYRLTDPWLDPVAREELATDRERPIRLPHSFWCYDPAAMTVGFRESCPVGPPPALAQGYVTFGFMGNFAKINRRVLELWARLLEGTGDARLLLRAPEGRAQEDTVAYFAEQGICDRLRFLAPCPREVYLRQYAQIDIGLDPFPYNGHTTSLDALWMGVPVVTLAGTTLVGRAGVSQLGNLGLPELCAATTADYLRIASSLAGDLPRLTALRQSLRDRMLASPLTDARGFAHGVEAAYRQMASASAANE